MKKLSVVVVAYNEEKNIVSCLESFRGIADEIIVIDCSSNDRTGLLARKYTTHVFERPNNPLMKINMNYGFSKASGDWILSLDADERITPELIEEIRNILSSDAQYAGYSLPRKNIIFGKWIENSIWWPDYQLRLFQKGKGKFAEKHVHEQLTVQGSVGTLDHPILHENYTSVSQWIRKMEIYTDNEVQHRMNSHESINPLDALRYPTKDFLKTYFMQKGYKDGLHGLVLSILQAFYAEIIFAKMWEKQGFVAKADAKFYQSVVLELKHLGCEVRYWLYTVQIEVSRNVLKKFIYRLKRKGMLRKLQHRV